jgi:5'-nucleotidase
MLLTQINHFKTLIMNSTKKIVYIDMDNVIVDFKSGIEQITPHQRLMYEGDLDEVEGIFGLMKPLHNSIKSVEFLSKHFDIYVLSTAPWENPSAWSDKIKWIKKYLPEVCHKRLILSHNKHLNSGDYLIDDRTANGAGKFKGEHIHFGQADFPDWDAVIQYLTKVENL